MALGRGARKYAGSPAKGHRSVVADQAEQKAPAHRAGKCAADIVRTEASSRCGDALEPPDIGPCGIAARSQATAGGGSGPPAGGAWCRSGSRGRFPGGPVPLGAIRRTACAAPGDPPNDVRAPRTDGGSFRRTTVERTTGWRGTGRAGRQRQTGHRGRLRTLDAGTSDQRAQQGNHAGCRPRKGSEHVRWGARSDLPLGPAVESGCTSPSDGSRLPRGVAQASPKARPIAGTRWNGQL